MPFGFSFGSDITKTVTSDGAQVTFKVTYPSLRPNEYGSDSKRRDISEKFIQRAQDEVREYLKKKDPKSYPSVDEKNVRRMGKGNVTDNTTLLDKIAYASLSKYSLHFKDGEKVEKVTSTNNGKINCLLDLIGGNLKKTTSGTTGGWHQANSEIGNDEVTVTFEFDFSNVHENKDLLKWQGKVPEEPERRSESSNYDPYAPSDWRSQMEASEDRGRGIIGGKSTRRRRSNTHRRIKQRKQSRKNHTRRRKSIRK